MDQSGFFHISEIDKQRDRAGKRYHEFLRIPMMSTGLYVLPAGGTDSQSPHKEDEIYYVVRGKGKMRAGSESQSVSAGSVIFVAANVEHRFYDVEEELTVLVFFAPAESQG